MEYEDEEFEKLLEEIPHVTANVPQSESFDSFTNVSSVNQASIIAIPHQTTTLLRPQAFEELLQVFQGVDEQEPVEKHSSLAYAEGMAGNLKDVTVNAQRLSDQDLLLALEEEVEPLTSVGFAQSKSPLNPRAVNSTLSDSFKELGLDAVDSNVRPVRHPPRQHPTINISFTGSDNGRTGSMLAFANGSNIVGKHLSNNTADGPANLLFLESGANSSFYGTVKSSHLVNPANVSGAIGKGNATKIYTRDAKLSSFQDATLDSFQDRLVLPPHGVPAYNHVSASPTSDLGTYGDAMVASYLQAQRHARQRDEDNEMLIHHPQSLQGPIQYFNNNAFILPTFYTGGEQLYRGLPIVARDHRWQFTRVVASKESSYAFDPPPWESDCTFSGQDYCNKQAFSKGRPSVKGIYFPSAERFHMETQPSVPVKILSRKNIRTLASSPTAFSGSILDLGNGHVNTRSHYVRYPLVDERLEQHPCIKSMIDAPFLDVCDASGALHTQLRCTSLTDLEGQIYLAAKDQYGCRFLQCKFDEGIPEEKQKIFMEIIDHVVELMTDPFGNYLIQKLLEVCDEDQRLKILNNVTSKGELIPLSLNMHGTRAVQKLIETVKSDQQVSIIITSLKPGVIILIKDLNGNHVVQKCLQHLDNEKNQFIFEAAALHCVEIATHRHGCCVLQRCIDHSKGLPRQRLVSEIATNSLLLSQDPFGNYVVQYVLELGIPWVYKEVMECLAGNYTHLSMQKFGSNVVEKFLKLAGEDHRAQIVHELIESSQFAKLLQDPYANYVMQSALSVSKGSLHTSLVQAIRPHVPSLRDSIYGKRILSRSRLKKC